MREESGRRVNMGLLCLVMVSCFASLIVTPRGYKSKWSPFAPLHPLTQSIIASSPPSLRVKRKREREREREGERGDFWDLESVAAPSLSSHGGRRLDPFHDHARSSTKPHESGVHDGDRAHDPPRV
jgi:hypothetical protein